MSERTEPATPKRLRQAREKGQVPASRDAVATAALIGASAALWAVGTRAAERFRASLEPALRAASQSASDTHTPVTAAVDGLDAAGRQGLHVFLPVLLAASVAAIAVASLLTGFLFAPAAASPNLDRLNPSAALQRYLRPRTYVEPVVQLAKGAVLLWLGWSALRLLLPTFSAVARAPNAVVGAHVAAVARSVATRMLLGATAFAALDVAYRRWQHQRDLRMTRDEVRREHRESEGDPHAKSARERVHRELLQEAALSRVAKASFVVTNPTHYAVALEWDADTMEAPQVLVRGEGLTAQRIIAEAHRAGVPVLRDAPLARSLHTLETGTEIPQALFEAVAFVVHYLSSGHSPDNFPGSDSVERQ